MSNSEWVSSELSKRSIMVNGEKLDAFMESGIQASGFRRNKQCTS